MTRKTVANDKLILRLKVLDAVNEFGSATVQQVMSDLRLSGPAKRRAVQRKVTSLHREGMLGRYLDTTSPHRRYIYFSKKPENVPSVPIRRGSYAATVIERSIANAYRSKKKDAARHFAKGLPGTILKIGLKGQLSRERYALLYSHDPHEATEIVKEHLRVRSNTELSDEGEIYRVLISTAFEYMEKELPVKSIDLYLSLNVEDVLEDLRDLTLAKYGATWESK